MGTHVRRSTQKKWRERWIFADQWASEIRKYFFREMGILAKLLISPEKGYLSYICAREYPNGTRDKSEPPLDPTLGVYIHRVLGTRLKG